MNFTKIFLPTDYACCNKTEMLLPFCHLASGAMQCCDCTLCTRTLAEGFSVVFSNASLKLCLSATASAVIMTLRYLGTKSRRGLSDISRHT